MSMKLHCKTNTLVRALSVAALSAALVACASVPQTPESIVQKRSQEYWQARIAAKPEVAYRFATPAYRALRSVDQYRAQFGPGAAVESAETIDVKCPSAERCTTLVRLQVRPLVPGRDFHAIATHREEVWLNEQGQWWLYQNMQ